jgi:hypothetical protein
MSNKNQVLLLAIIAIVMSIIYDTTAQGFKGIAVVGSNFSQLDGDTLFGFDKVGLSVGGRMYFEVSQKKHFASIEMLYSQRGSAVKLFDTQSYKNVNLRYLELPVMYNIQDWYIDDGGYYKVAAEGGLSYSYLFGATTQNYNESTFNKHSISYVAGTSIRLNKRLGLGIRYTSSLGNAYDDKQPQNPVKLKSYFLTIRTEIYLN